MASIFDNVVPELRIKEAGEVNSDSDYGGLTKFGLSQREYPNIDISRLTEAEALAILKQDYWDHYKLDTIEYQRIANQIFFLLINMNPLHAGTIVQTALNACSRGLIKVVVDGIIGSETIARLNQLAPFWLSDRIRVESCRYYLKEADANPAQRANFRGWVRRVIT
jgi:lysozyme family protein